MENVRVVLEETHMSVEIHGSGEKTFLLLHGIPGWRGTWSQVARQLSASATVLVPDLLGFGDSGPPGADCHATGQAAAVLAMLQARGISAVHLVGFDFGGPIACTLLRIAPSRVRSLTLIATNVFPDTPIPGPLRIAGVPILGEAAFRLMMGRTGLSMMWLAAVKNRTAFPWSRYRLALTPGGVRWTRRIFLFSLRHLDMLYRPVQQGLADIDVPVTVIWGAADPFFPGTVGRRTAASISGARYVEVPECGHFVPEEHPEAVLRELRLTASASS
jgi:pimeloyl-ACP methyl ester carboxylesterase